MAIGLGGRRIGPIASTAVATALGVALSVSVELLQLLVPERYTSPFDVLTNGVGAALGAVAGWLGSRWAWPVLVPRLRRVVTHDPMAALAVGTAAAIGLAAITPFDIRPDERSVKEAIKRRG